MPKMVLVCFVRAACHNDFCIPVCYLLFWFNANCWSCGFVIGGPTPFYPCLQWGKELSCQLTFKFFIGIKFRTAKLQINLKLHLWPASNEYDELDLESVSGSFVKD
ncbi:uncharacterized protein LOC117642065 isoform X2 [Thrips palmi]|uniref:Uncharacterized protein LOC117642065 isoform X2 n=1 Tax=Thrips palmi TaxID=161013 RepID=A0A6P8ZJQ5_THRPL|nr:uncharacterized protein LOC117642065 isoform X2 [Thrips palmi]